MRSSLFQLIHSVFGIHSFLLLEIYVFSILFQIETMTFSYYLCFFSCDFLKLLLLRYSLYAVKITLCMCSVRCALTVCSVSTAPPPCPWSQRFPLAHSGVLIDQSQDNTMSSTTAISPVFPLTSSLPQDPLESPYCISLACLLRPLQARLSGRGRRRALARCFWDTLSRGLPAASSCLRCAHAHVGEKL